MIIIYKRILSRCKRLFNFYNHYLINFIYPFPFGSSAGHCFAVARAGGIAATLLESD